MSAVHVLHFHVLHFHILQFHALLLRPFVSRPAISVIPFIAAEFYWPERLVVSRLSINITIAADKYNDDYCDYDYDQ